MSVLAADTLQGDRVVTRSGEDVGCIEDLVIDVQRGTVAYAVVSAAGLPGLADRLFAIPWNALALDPAQRCFVLDADPARLRAAPAFNRGQWPSMADAAWANQVHDYYGVHPYWEAGMPSSEGG